MTTRPAESLTRQLLFERALAIVDTDGLDALTMRRLAAKLGVQAPSLYNHVSGKDDLLDGALRVMRAEIRPPSPAPDDWKELMAAIFTDYWRVLSAHPTMMPLAGRRLPWRERQRPGVPDQPGLQHRRGDRDLAVPARPHGRVLPVRLRAHPHRHPRTPLHTSGAGRAVARRDLPPSSPGSQESHN